jgi:hypothetical protein
MLCAGGLPRAWVDCFTTITHYQGNDFSAISIQGNPNPLLVGPAGHKGPHLVTFQDQLLFFCPRTSA